MQRVIYPAQEARTIYPAQTTGLQIDLNTILNFMLIMIVMAMMMSMMGKVTERVAS